MKIKKILAVTCACLIGLTAVGIAEVSDVISDDIAAITANAASSEVSIDAAHFPDANFREYVKEFDTDKNGSFSADEIAAVTYIDCAEREIRSLKGIEKFTALENLNCGYNRLETLDVSKNTALELLNCSDNQLTELDVSKNTALIFLFCYGNRLTELDVSKNTALKYLSCGSNQLKTLDVSQNTALTSLDCSFNYNHEDGLNQTLEEINKTLEKIDVTANTALEELNCGGNLLTELDVSNNTTLEKLSCSGNELTELDVSKNTALISLSCNSNELTKLDVSKNTALTYLDCVSNELTKLDVSGCENLSSLSCFENKLTELDVSKNTALEELGCSNNELTKLNVSGCEKLETLSCSYNKLTELDVSKNTALISLSCNSNELTKLDVSKNTALTYLDCVSNELTKLNVSGCEKLDTLYCYDNKLTEIDISGNPNIVKAYTKGEEDKNISEYAKDAIGKYYKNGETYNTNYYFIWGKAAKVITESKPHTHTWDSGKVTKAATYAATGVKTYTCTVCGAEKTSSIAKKTVKKLTAKTTYTCTTNAIRINWNKLSGVTGYKIFRYDDAKKKWVAVKAIYNPNTTNYKISGLKSGKVYKFRVKAFVKENGKFYFGESCSTISTATRPNTTTVTKANKTSTAVRLFWKKTTCTGYRILRYDSATKKWVRVTAVGSSATTQYKISGLKKNTTYKFKVQPYVKVGSKVIDGAASAVFTVKTAK